MGPVAPSLCIDSIDWAISKMSSSDRGRFGIGDTSLLNVHPLVGRVGESRLVHHQTLRLRVNTMNARYGLNTVYLGSIHNVRNQAPTRIPFGPPPPLEEFDDPADNVRKPMTRYTLTPEELARLAQKKRAFR
jgi:hypothetical protein